MIPSGPDLPDAGVSAGRPDADLWEELAALEALVMTHAPQAQERAGALLARARAAAEPEAEGQALCLCGAAQFFQSDYEGAGGWFREALALGERLHDLTLQARALNGLGNVANLRGDYAGALDSFSESARLSWEAGDELGRARVLNNVGLVHAELGDYGAALQTHLQVLEMAERLGHSLLASSARINTLTDHHYLGDHDRALALAAECLQDTALSGLRQHEVIVQAFRARSLLEVGEAQAARAASEETLPVALEIGEHKYALLLLDTLARVHLQEGNWGQAATLLRRALTVAGERGMRVQERDAHALLADVHEAAGEWPEAVRHLRAYHALERALHDEEVDRKTRVLTAQFQVETLRREAEMERLRSEQLSEANTALQHDRELLAHRAAHDTLTGLANRAHFQAVTEQALRGCGPDLVAVLFIDLDHFKPVNDRLGHEAGDELLRQVAARLRGAVRRDDLVARVGGDEFTVLLRHLTREEDAERVAHKLLGALSQPFSVAGQELWVTASVGIALAPRHGLDVETLQRRADEAMYRVKRGSRGGVLAFGS